MLDEPQISELLRHPRLLLQLQEAVLTAGEAYWHSVPRDPELLQQIERQWKAIEKQISESENSEPELASAPGKVTRRTWTWSALAAASVLIGFGLWFARSGTPTWGFDQSGLLTANVGPAEYLDRLADAAGDWFNKRPDDADVLAKRLREFRHGCDTLIQAPHPQLSEIDRDWLVERCEAWRAKIDGHLANLQSGQFSVAEVRAAADETVRNLQAALRERAVS